MMRPAACSMPRADAPSRAQRYAGHASDRRRLKPPVTPLDGTVLGHALTKGSTLFVHSHADTGYRSQSRWRATTSKIGPATGARLRLSSLRFLVWLRCHIVGRKAAGLLRHATH